MSLYTPVFPGQHDNNTSIRDTKDYVDLLRNVHLFLSTQGDMLAPPSRPSSPNFEERVSQLRENVREAFLDAKGEPANGMWTQLTEQLKMQCMRGGAGSASTTDDQVAVEQDVEWILPETEQEWFEWQAKREQEKCLKKKAISMQQDYDTVPLAADQPEHTSSIATRQMAVPEQGTSNVSPSTILRAKEKVKKWQAAINPNSTSTPHFQYSQSRTSKERVSGAGVKGKALAFAKGSSSLNFPVVKRAAGTAHDNKGKGPPVRHSASNNRVAVGDSTASPIIPSAIVDSGNAELASSKASHKASPTITAKPKINDFPETVGCFKSILLFKTDRRSRLSPSVVSPAILSIPVIYFDPTPWRRTREIHSCKTTTDPANSAILFNTAPIDTLRASMYTRKTPSGQPVNLSSAAIWFSAGTQTP